MGTRLSRGQVLRRRMRSQRLHPRAAGSVGGVAGLVRDLCGVQAQELPAAALAIRARSHGLVADDVRRAREEERSIVLTWCMRGTMHLVAADDVGWLLGLLGPLFIHKAQRRYARLGLDGETRARATRTIRDELAARGPLTRAELAEALAAKGIPVAGQAIAYLIRHAALEGAICFGPYRDNTPTYVLFEGWVQPSGRLDAGRAGAELARRYLEAYGPATPADLASWSGITLGQARAGFSAIADRLEAAGVDGARTWMLARSAGRRRESSDDAAFDERPGERVVRLLPRYDPYLLGYQNREAIVDAAHARRLHPGGGQIASTLIVDGRAVAVWKALRRRGGITIAVEPFGPLDPDVLPGLEAEVGDIGRFLRQEAALSVTEGQP